MSERFSIAPEVAALLQKSGLSDGEAFFRWSQGRRLDKRTLESWRQRWRMVLPDGAGGEKVFYLKRFERPPLRRQLSRWLAGQPGRSTAGVEWENCQVLSKAGIAAAEGVAFGEQMGGPLERRSFVLLAEVPGEALERWVPAHLPLAQDRSRAEEASVRRLIDALARFVAAFHRAGFVHRDLYLSHIFIQTSEGNGTAAFRLIDLQRVFQPRWRRRRWVIKDLAALHFSTPEELVSPRDRLRFLARYRRECNAFGSAHELAAAISRKAGRIARHEANKVGAVRSPQTRQVADGVNH